MYLVLKVGDGVKNCYLDIADWYKSLRNHCSKKVVDCNYLAWPADGHRWQLLSYSWMLSCEVRSLAKCLYTMSCPYPPMLKNFPNARFSLWAICESTNSQHHSGVQYLCSTVIYQDHSSAKWRRQNQEMCKPKTVTKTKNKEIQFTFEGTILNYLDFLSVMLMKHGYNKYTPVTNCRHFGIKIIIPPIRASVISIFLLYL